MKVEEQYGNRERRELEALEESEKLPRITIFEDGPDGWRVSSPIRWIKDLILGRK